MMIVGFVLLVIFLVDYINQDNIKFILSSILIAVLLLILHGN